MQEAKKSVLLQTHTCQLEWSEGKKKNEKNKTNFEKQISITLHRVIYLRPVIYTDEPTHNDLIYFHILVKGGP